MLLHEWMLSISFVNCATVLCIQRKKLSLAQFTINDATGHHIIIILMMFLVIYFDDDVDCKLILASHDFYQYFPVFNGQMCAFASFVNIILGSTKR